MTEVLRQGALGATLSAFGFEPVQVILQLQVPQRNLGTQSGDHAAQRATHVDDGARRLAPDFIEVTEVALD